VAPSDLCGGATWVQVGPVTGMLPPSRASIRLLAYSEDLAEVQALRRGSEDAFRALALRHHDTLMRVARTWVRDPAVAEEVVQQTWITVLERFDSFEARSSVWTWLCGICINTARARARAERRSVPLSSLGAQTEAGPEPAVDPARLFGPETHWAGHWIDFPNEWPPTPEDSAGAAELRARLEAAVETLPDAMREVLLLRDVEEFTSEEVCTLLGITEGNLRVLLHRARSRLRGQLEDFFDKRRPS
jgi:RNA polymerase sigma-70 factor, ECF subfamily